jgi:hypothetical protein
MSVTLSDGTTTVTLHPDLLWSDEFNWHPVEQSAQRTVTGALIVQVATRVAGRPITLEPEDDSSAWMLRSVVEQLRNWAAVPGQELELTLRGVARDVVFRHQDGAGLEAVPVVHFSDSDVASSDWYRCTLRLMEI